MAQGTETKALSENGNIPVFLKTELHRLDVGGLLALGAVHHIKSNSLIFFQAFETFGSNRGKVGEHVITTTIRGNEAEAF
jgi:hypothetical protein